MTPQVIGHITCSNTPIIFPFSSNSYASSENISATFKLFLFFAASSNILLPIFFVSGINFFNLLICDTTDESFDHLTYISHINNLKSR